MKPIIPEEDREILLPKACYFNDGRRKVDYVLVYPKLEEHVRGDSSSIQIEKFLAQAREKGLQLERELGKHHTKLYFVKIHAPHRTLVNYANIYDILLTCQNPYYKYYETHPLGCMTTQLTKRDPDSDVYKRAERSLSGKRPSELTTLERSEVVFQILKRISFVFEDDELRLKELLEKEVFLEAYPIHDGDYKWTDQGPLTDRQLLYTYWAHLKYIFREQPVHLIEKYYGTKLGFYFALVSLYTKMLFVPTVVGTTTVIAGLIIFDLEGEYLTEEVCNSDMVLCSDQKLKTACGLFKIAFVIDNPVTIAYVILCAFWGTIFWNLWQRRQAMLRLRWNVTGMKASRPMRREFQEKATTRTSSVTGEIEHYVPPFKNFLFSVFSYFIVVLMIFIFFLIVILVVEYRFFLRENVDYDEADHPNEMELLTSSILTSVLIMVADTLLPFVLKLYSKLIRFLASLRMPRTKARYKEIVLQMTFIISFVNHFSALFYLAYIKGFFNKHPGAISENEIISILQKDMCHPSGCLLDLGFQIITILTIKTASKCTVNLIQYLASPWHKFAIPKDKEDICGQWEKDFPLHDLDHSVVENLYVDMVLQYSFITFFNGSLPIIGVIALIHNLLKIQHDAFRFLKSYRRPLFEKVPDTEGWNDILRIVTILGTISNAYVVAFRTDFILRTLYKRKHNGTMEGYINSTLSVFAIEDFHDDTMFLDHTNETVCFYRGFRFHPEHERKYKPTKDFWHFLAMKSIYFIILENVTVICSLVLGYLIPEMPRKMRLKLEYDEKMLKAAREAQMESEA